MVLVWAIMLMGSLLVPPTFAQENKSTKKILLAEYKGGIDPRSSRLLDQILDKAEGEKFSALFFELDTYGGTLDDADKMRKRLLAAKLPVWVFINPNAASAGALISLACDSIYMAPGASIGAATVVTGGAQPLPDKYQSYMRSLMRATAQKRGRNPDLAQQMVGYENSPDSAHNEGVLTLTTDEAIEKGMADGTANSMAEVIAKTSFKNAQQETFVRDSIDEFVDIFLNPALSGILLLIILGGIYFELQTPGVGFPGIAALIAAILYFIPYYMAGLAEHWEFVVVFAGLVLIALEVFVIPGFGIAGISGLVLFFGGLLLVMVSNDGLNFTPLETQDLSGPLLTLGIGFVGAILLIVLGGFKLLQKVADTSEGAQAVLEKGLHFEENVSALQGQTGIVLTPMRPTGKIEINGKIYTAITRGEAIDKGKTVKVIQHEVNNLVVTEVA